jgi:hypothetical protein
MNKKIQQIGRHRVRYYREPDWPPGTCWVYDNESDQYLGMIERTENPRRYNGKALKVDAALELLTHLWLVRQPEGSNQCGQACVATICGITLDESLTLFCCKGCTTTKRVVAALRQMGVECGDRLVRGFPEKGSAILKFTHTDGHSHWVVWHRKKYYDPEDGVSQHPAGYLTLSRVTSHLPLTIEEP